MVQHAYRSLNALALVAALGLSALPMAAGAQGLAELYQSALRGNAILKARQFDVERARAESDGARSRLLPQVTAQGSWSRNEYRDANTSGENSYGGRRGTLNARQSLYDPASYRRLGAARATILQREQELAQTRVALFGELLDRYLQVLAAQDELAWLAGELQAATRQVDRLRAMRERQMAKVTDLAEADAYYQGLITRRIDANNAQAEALSRLTELCGVAVKKVPALSRTTLDAAPGTWQDWVSRSLAGSPRLLALTQAVESARRNARASRAEHLPSVAATLSSIYSDQGFDNRQQPPYRAASLGVELRVPLYEGGRVDALVREAAARQGAAEQQLASARREVERETLSTWWSAKANHARIGSTRAEVNALEQTVRAQEQGLELGVSRVTDLLDARRRLLKARADQSKARYDFVRDVIALNMRIGDVNDADVAAWDRWFDRRR